MRTTCKLLKNLLISSSIFALISLPAMAREHLIYSIDEEIPMGYENEITRKNYYVDIGSNQGVSPGTTLDVFRTISKLNPYNNLRRVNYKVKIGEIKVLHSDNEAAIGSLKLLKADIDTPLFELKGFMIGDYVSVNVNN